MPIHISSTRSSSLLALTIHQRISWNALTLAIGPQLIWPTNCDATLCWRIVACTCLTLWTGAWDVEKTWRTYTGRAWCHTILSTNSQAKFRSLVIDSSRGTWSTYSIYQILTWHTRTSWARNVALSITTFYALRPDMLTSLDLASCNSDATWTSKSNTTKSVSPINSKKGMLESWVEGSRGINSNNSRCRKVSSNRIQAKSIRIARVGKLSKIHKKIPEMNQLNSRRSICDYSNIDLF